jgi:hypothetical protein
MADTGIFATTEEVQRKVGDNASATSNTEAYINQFMTEAESVINAVSRYNWSDAYSGLNADVKGILKLAASNLAAIYVINYDMDSLPTMREAENRVNVLYENYQLAIGLLREQAQKKFIQDA